jgi:hypothetical protein
MAKLLRLALTKPHAHKTTNLSPSTGWNSGERQDNLGASATRMAHSVIQAGTPGTRLGGLFWQHPAVLNPITAQGMQSYLYPEQL